MIWKNSSKKRIQEILSIFYRSSPDRGKAKIQYYVRHQGIKSVYLLRAHGSGQSFLPTLPWETIKDKNKGIIVDYFPAHQENPQWQRQHTNMIYRQGTPGMLGKKIKHSCLERTTEIGMRWNEWVVTVGKTRLRRTSDFKVAASKKERYFISPLSTGHKLKKYDKQMRST